MPYNHLLQGDRRNLGDIHTATRKVQKWLSILTYIGMLIPLVIIITAMVEKPAMVFTNHPFPLSEAASYQPGGSISLITEYCATRKTTVTIQKHVINVDTGLQYHLPDTTINVDKNIGNCPDAIVLEPIRLSPALQDGKHEVVLTTKTPGILRRHTDVLRSQPFTIKTEGSIIPLSN